MTMRPPVTNLPILLDDISFAVRDVTILDRITLALSAGAPTVVVGPNGAGKTTLLRLAMGLIQPTAGRATWGGRADASSDRRAIVFQRPVMLRRSAEANLRYALEAANVPGAEHGLRACASCWRWSASRTSATAQRASSPAANSSGWRWHARSPRTRRSCSSTSRPRVSIRRRPSRSRISIRDIAARGIKVVMSTHDLGEARRLAGDVVLMHRGRIVEASDAKTFFNNPKTEEAHRFVAGELLV